MFHRCGWCRCCGCGGRSLVYVAVVIAPGAVFLLPPRSGSPGILVMVAITLAMAVIYFLFRFFCWCNVGCSSIVSFDFFGVGLVCGSCVCVVVAGL